MEEYYFYTEGLTVGYHGVPLIKNIKISLKKGEILTLIGPNGAGKTTILRSIIKQLKPLGGVVVLDGKETEQISGKRAFQKTFGCTDRTGKTGNDDLQRSGCDRTLSIYREVRRTLKRRLETGR